MIVRRQVLPNGRVQYRESTVHSVPGIWVGQQRVAEALRETIEDYISSHRGSAENWSKLSCHNVPHQDLTYFLRSQHLISETDNVYVAGNEGIADKEGKGFQIGIGPFKGTDGTFWSREDAWFIWNAYGYDFSADHSGFIRLNDSGESHFRFPTEEILLRVASLKNIVGVSSYTNDDFP